ncbi:MAG: N4-gp56 family major capsid protein [Proteobacteria bacterium]|nr:N4-gp56 family major capsid protein [Pseudomonadota bacterium]MCH9735801.1 N4-gp56 family major capsid protein [Actinomycetes bacterium]
MSGIATRTPVLGTSGFLSTKVQAVYDRNLLLRVTPNEVFDRFGQAKVIPAKSNAKKGFAYRYKNILPATTPIAEYSGSNIKAPNKIVREEVEFAVNHYGDYIVYTDELDLYDFDTVNSSFLNVLGDQASITLDTIRRDALRGGTNVIFADGATDRDTVATGGKLITASDLKLATVKLKNQRAKKFKKVITGSTKIATTPIRAGYVGVTSPEVIEDLRNLAGWKDVENYADYSKAMPDEIGSWGDIRFIESYNNDPVDPTGAGAGTNVYLTLVLGEDAYATTSVRGKGGIMTKVKPLGSAGAEDPLDQYGTIGWKAIAGCAILNEAFLVRLESVASIEDANAKHYYDYS